MKLSCILALGVLILSAVSNAQQATLAIQLGHSEAVSSVAISADSRYVLTGSDDRTARLWELASGREIRRFEGHSAIVTAIAISPDGRYVLTGSVDKTARLWDIASGREVRRYIGHPDLVTAVAFSKNGQYVMTGSQDHTARLWDTFSGRELKRFQLSPAESFYAGSVESVAFSPDGQYVLGGYGEGWQDKNMALLWDIATGREVRRFAEHSSNIRSVAFSPDGRYVLTGNDDGTVLLSNTADGREVRRFEGHKERVTSVAFAGSHPYILTGSYDKTARLWDLRTGVEIRRFQGHTAPLTSAVFSQDDRFVLTGSYDKTARLWDSANGVQVRAFQGDVEDVSSVAFSRDGLHLVMGGYDHTARIWDFTSRQTGRLLDTDLVICSTFSPDGHYLVTGSVDGATLWELERGRAIRHFHGHTNSINSVTFSPDGQFVLTGSTDKTARLWSVATGVEIRQFVGHSASVRAAVFSSDGRYALTGSEDETARLWDAATGHEIQRFNSHSKVLAVAFFPDQRSVLTGSKDGTIRLWNPRGKELWRIRAGDSVWSISVSSDGRSVLAGGYDKVARIWDLTSTKELVMFRGHSSTVSSVAFSPDGRLVLTGSLDGTARLWDAHTGSLVSVLASFRGGGWAVVDRDGRFDTSELDGGAPLSWIVDDQPLRPLPFEIFMRQYYTPRLLPRLLVHERLPQLPNIASLNRIQPEVRFVSVESDPTHVDAVRAVVSVKSRREAALASGARDLRIFRDGQLVRFQEGEVKDGEYLFDGIPLAHKGPKQEVLFTAYAFNTDLVKSETAKAESYKVPRNWPERQGRAFLVDIGINRTAAQGCNLRYTVADATSMQSVLKQRLQAAGYGVEEHLLTAGEGQPNGASKTRLQTVLTDIAQRATPDDVFILTYSGHGYTDPEGLFYVFPSDLQGNCAHVDGTLTRSAISSDELTTWIRPIDAGEMVMILDACYSAQIVGGRDFKPGPMGSPGLGQLAYDKRIRVLVASQAEQPAGEAGRLGMGYLSYALLKDGLEKGNADWQPHDHSIWLREWLAWGVQQVPNLYTTEPGGKNTTGNQRGIKVNRTGAVSLQTPALFDFRADQEQGLLLQKVN